MLFAGTNTVNHFRWNKHTSKALLDARGKFFDGTFHVVPIEDGDGNHPIFSRLKKFSLPTIVSPAISRVQIHIAQGKGQNANRGK